MLPTIELRNLPHFSINAGRFGLCSWTSRKPDRAMTGDLTSSIKGVVKWLVQGSVAAILCCSTTTAALADVRFSVADPNGTGEVFVASLDGEIVQNDVDALVTATESAPASAMKILVVNSEGGDLTTAMMIGRFVRAMHFDVVVPETAECYSACVFVLAAGIDKRVRGRVGIHRPYFGNIDPAKAADAIKATKLEVDNYLAEMNIPSRLSDDMFSIDPIDMRMLSGEELQDYRLNTMDYVAREANSVKSAETYGLSRQDYEIFIQDLNYSCQIAVADVDAFKTCAAEVAGKHGVSLPSGFLK